PSLPAGGGEAGREGVGGVRVRPEGAPFSHDDAALRPAMGSFPHGVCGARNFGDSFQSVLMETGMKERRVREPVSAWILSSARPCLGRLATSKTGRRSITVIASWRAWRSRRVLLSMSLSFSL